jgi:bifunctional non-homologous end joining protein LigD
MTWGAAGTGLGKAQTVPKAPLDEYRRKRDPARTPEPVPPPAPGRPGRVATKAKAKATTSAKATTKAKAKGAKRPTFVIQEHHASSLHWDFRLEHDGVLASWALPKGLPRTPDENHLAVQVEDHPLEYGSFHGTIPSGEYGAGAVSIWDRGTYDCEKWRPDEVMVVLHGQRATGRYVLFPTKGTSWMIHRMDPAPDGFVPLPTTLSPMLATAGTLPADPDGWAFEFKWDGIRALLWVDGGRPRALSRGGKDLTVAFPELHELAASVGSDQVVLDGELVVLDGDGRASFSRLQHRIHVSSARDAKQAASRDPASMVVFDLLHLNGRSLLDAAYDDRRAQLDQLGLAGASWGVTPSFTSERGRDVLSSAVRLGFEGVVAKRRSSAYRPGSRSHDWIKVKDQRTQEVVIGGWTDGEGARASTFGALLVGIPAEGTRGKLTYAGNVGTGFSQAELDRILALLTSAPRATSPFTDRLPGPIEAKAHWVRPSRVAEVRFGEWTPAGRLRHPVWRGLRTDKVAGEVRREP